MSWEIPANPFVGLRPFQSEDSMLFFGRDKQIRELLDQLHKTRFLAVVGGSGSGKSSLIRAGLIPGLLGGFLVYDRDIWKIASMKPGDSPIHNLVSALCHSLGKNDKAVITSILSEIEENGIRAILDILKSELNASDVNFLLLVDQFEEIFRFGLQKKNTKLQEQAEEFCSLMLELAEQDEFPVYVIMTMRSDYLGDCDIFTGLPEALNRSQYLVPRLTREQRREAIVGPAHLAGTRIEPRLLDRLLNESVNRIDELPVLQHALLRTWHFWQMDGKDTLDVEHYENAQTVKKALDHHAEEAYEQLSDKEKPVAKRLFQALTQVDPGNRRIRRPKHLNELVQICQVDAAELMSIIDKFQSNQRNFLVCSKNIHDNPLVDISHESLIRQWDRLKIWVDEEAESAQTYQELVQRANRHIFMGAGLLEGIELDINLRWKNNQNPNKNWAGQYNVFENFPEGHFERALAYLDKSQREQREQRRVRVFTRMFATVLFVSLIMVSVFFIILRNRVLDSEYAIGLVYEEKASGLLRTDPQIGQANPQKAWLYTLAALNQSTPKNKVLPASWGRLAEPQFYQNNFLPVDVQTFTSTRRLSCLALNPAASMFVTSAEDDNVLTMWDATTGQRIKVLPKEHEETITAVAFSHDGRTIITGGADNRIKLWDSATGAVTSTFILNEQDVRAVAISPDNYLVASVERFGEITLRSAQSGNVIGQIPTDFNETILSLAFSSSGDLLAAGFSDRTIKFWDTKTRRLQQTWQTPTDRVTSLAFSSNDSIFASGSDAGVIRIWNVATEEQRSGWIGHHQEVMSLAFAPDDRTLMSGSDHTIKRWDVSPDQRWERLNEHEESVTAIAYSPDGEKTISGSQDKTVRLWVAETGQGRQVGEQPGDVTSITISPNGQRMVTGSKNAAIQSWDLATGERRSLKSSMGTSKSVRYNRDGSLLAAAYPQTRQIKLWDTSADQWQLIDSLQGHSQAINDIAFHPDGSVLASASSDGTVKLWDARTGAELLTLTSDNYNDPVLSVVFHPDGRDLAAGYVDGTIVLWNVSNGKASQSFGDGPQQITQLIFSPNGDMLAAVSSNRIRLWDVASGLERARLGDGTAQITSIAFSPDGGTLLSGSEDGAIQRWNMRLINLWKKGGSPQIERLFEASQYVLGYRLNNIELEPVSRAEFERKYPQLDKPRPVQTDPFAWLLQAVK